MANPTDNLNAAASAEVESSLDKFRQDLLDEAARLEANLNAGGAPAEVTAAMIRDANLIIRRGYMRRKRTKGQIAVQFISLGGSALLGVGASNMGTGRGQLAFAVGLLVAVGAAGYGVVSER